MYIGPEPGKQNGNSTKIESTQMTIKETSNGVISFRSPETTLPIDRREFIKNLAAVSIGARISRGAGTSPVAQPPQKGYYSIAAAILPRHAKVEETFPVLARYREKGYTGVWNENDYLRWSWSIHPDQGFLGNWMLFNIFDFILSKERALYQKYLFQLCGKCAELGLDFYGSFWLPKLNIEMRDYLREHIPNALGSCMLEGQRQETLCTCHDGAGLGFLEQMVSIYFRLSPDIRGLKVATLDNGCFICDETCPHAHGTSRVQHVANLYGSVQKAMQGVRADAQLFVYEWFWGQGYLQEIQKQITPPYFIVCKIEVKTRQHLEAAFAGEPLFDASNLTGEEGSDYKEDVDAVGAQRLVEMPAMGSGIDDFFFGSPPFPGRLHRRMQLHRKVQCDKFFEFECGTHWADSNEEAYAIFNAYPEISPQDLLERIASVIYTNPEARKLAILGWRHFDEGYGHLPIGLGETNCQEFSGRFGFAWTMCIATPLVREAFGDTDQKHRIHWFSPYNFFNRTLVDRLETQFLQVQSYWQQAENCLSAAAALDGDSIRSRHEAIAARAHLLGVASALNWCNACRYASNPALRNSFADVIRAEIGLTQQFLALSSSHVWVWDNCCWHPHQTPMSQKYLGFEGLQTHNTFEAKLAIMKGGDAPT
jgi:hypothetical protein